MKQKYFHIVTGIYAILMLAILAISVIALVRTRFHVQTIVQKETKPLYLYADRESTSSEIPATSAEEGWIVQTYEHQIGIFKQDGTLIRILDTYVKTLPKADQIMLEEGIRIETKAALYALIEDYTE